MIGSRRPLATETSPFVSQCRVVDDKTLAPLRTKLLTPESTTYAEPRIDGYADRRQAQLERWNAQGGQQPGDPTKLAQALVLIAGQEQPPRRFVAGADAIGLTE